MGFDTAVTVGPGAVTIKGVDVVIHRLNVFPNRLQKKIRRRVVLAAGKIIRTKIRDLCGRGFGEYSEGWYKKSIGIRVRTYGDYTVAIVGPRLGRQFRNRANLAHLIEHGWRVGRHGTGTLARKSGRSAASSRVTGKAGEGVVAGRVEGKRILGRAHRATLRQVQNTLVQGLREAVIDTVRELRQEGK